MSHHSGAVTPSEQNQIDTPQFPFRITESRFHPNQWILLNTEPKIEVDHKENGSSWVEDALENVFTKP